ncbi:unnamed protein product [Calypogeia fissa]
MTENSSLAACEVVMWKRPVLALLLLGSGTLVWYYCGPLQRSALSLMCDVLLTFVCSLGLLGVICRHLHLSIPVDPLEWQVSPEVANDIAACLANTIGAAEGVLRVAASGSDSKLFSKVVAVLYIASAVGRAASGATVAYIGPVSLIMIFLGGSLAVLWFMFIVPLGMAKLSPEGSCNTPTFLQKKSNVLGSYTPGNSPKSTISSPQRVNFFSLTQ